MDGCLCDVGIEDVLICHVDLFLNVQATPRHQHLLFGGSYRWVYKTGAREGGRTSGPTPVSESDIQAVAQRCGDSAVTVRRVWWMHVEVRKGKERSR